VTKKSIASDHIPLALKESNLSIYATNNKNNNNIVKKQINTKPKFPPTHFPLQKKRGEIYFMYI
jgi:hypothetical protein